MMMMKDRGSMSVKKDKFQFLNVSLYGLTFIIQTSFLSIYWPQVSESSPNLFEAVEHHTIPGLSPKATTSRAPQPHDTPSLTKLVLKAFDNFQTPVPFAEENFPSRTDHRSPCSKYLATQARQF
jgi:hypothetical protein